VVVQVWSKGVSVGFRGGSVVVWRWLNDGPAWLKDR
jgi:hypothetical protein